MALTGECKDAQLEVAPAEVLASVCKVFRLSSLTRKDWVGVLPEYRCSALKSTVLLLLLRLNLSSIVLLAPAVSDSKHKGMLGIEGTDDLRSAIGAIPGGAGKRYSSFSSKVMLLASRVNNLTNDFADVGRLGSGGVFSLRCCKELWTDFFELSDDPDLLRACLRPGDASLGNIGRSAFFCRVFGLGRLSIEPGDFTLLVAASCSIVVMGGTVRLLTSSPSRVDSIRSSVDLFACRDCVVDCTGDRRSFVGSNCDLAGSLKALVSGDLLLSVSWFGVNFRDEEVLAITVDSLEDEAGTVKEVERLSLGVGFLFALFICCRDTEAILALVVKLVAISLCLATSRSRRSTSIACVKSIVAT